MTVECPRCYQSFETRDELNKHFAADHPGPLPDAYRCPSCGGTSFVAKRTGRPGVQRMVTCVVCRTDHPLG